MIRIEQLHFSYEKRDILAIPAMAFRDGAVHGVIGLNGAGKTTFFNLLGGVLKPDRGGILRDEKALRTQDVGFLETDPFFYSGLTGDEYLRIFPQTNARYDTKGLNALLQLPLRGLVDGYSTGMKKKLALLAVIRQDKPVYIFDEPFNGLDLETNKVVELMVAALRERGKTVFLSSHILAPLTGCCDEIHLLQDGRFATTYGPERFADIEGNLFADFNARAEEIVRRNL